ncbi:hypothetical protein AAVH_12297 [Aphelenchoides avenae]|nr:hypothetical protein AAVH_12297 [Aphelenchus avenae]
MSALNARPSATDYTSEVWNHFSLVSPTLVRCNLCQKSFKPPTTTTYWIHLKCQHKETYVTTEYYKIGKGIRRSTLPKKFAFTEAQRSLLEEPFGRSPFPSDDEKTSIAQQFGVQVKNWFEGRRRVQRRSVGSETNGTAIEVCDANDDHAALGEDAQNEMEMSEVGSEPLETGSAEDAREPEAGQMPWAPLFADLLQSPLPMAPSQPTVLPTQVADAGLVETSGRLHLNGD